MSFSDVYFYYEPVKGDVYRKRLKDLPKLSHTVVTSDGVCYVSEEGERWFLETEAWKIKYQDSLSHKVSQGRVRVYYIYSMKKGKTNTSVLVVDDSGACYSTTVPTSPPPRFGESFIRLRMDLRVVSLEPKREFLDKVMAAREADPTLL